MRVNQTNCMHCGACASVCPADAIEVSDTVVRVGRGCTDCGLCERICPVGAIVVARKV